MLFFPRFPLLAQAVIFSYAPLFSFHAVSDAGPHQSPIRIKALGVF